MFKEPSRLDCNSISEVTRSFAYKDIFRKKLKSKSKQGLQEDLLLSKDRLKRPVINFSANNANLSMMRSKSLKMALSMMNNSTMNSTSCFKKLGETQSPSKIRDTLRTKSIDKTSLKESTSKKFSLPLKLYKSMSSLTILKRKSIPALSFSFNKKRATLPLKNKNNTESLLTKSKTALIAKELLASLERKKSQKSTTCQSHKPKLKIKKPCSKESDTIAKSHAIIVSKMMEIKLKLGKVLQEHQNMKEIITTFSGPN